MAILPPGVRFVGRGVAYMTVFVGGLVGATKIAESRGFAIPLWLVLTGAAVAIPTLAGLRIAAGEFKKRRRARALGARTVPKLQGKKFGNLDVLTTTLSNIAVGYPGDGLDEVIEARGPVFNFWLLWSDSIFTICPEHLKTILATDFSSHVKGPQFIRNMGSVLGSGVFNSDGEMWKFHRSITRPVFTRDRISDFDIFDHHTDIALQKLKERLREGYAVDFQDLMARFTLDTATQFLFGNCVNSLDAGLPYPAKFGLTVHQTLSGKKADDFARAFMEAQEAIANRERVGWIWPLFEFWKDKTEEPMKTVRAFIDPIVKEAIANRATQSLEEKTSGEKEIQDGQTLLDYLVNVTQDPTILRDEILNIMIAGRDTTAATLTFCIYLLSQHPDVFQRLRTEVLEKVGPSRRPNFDDLRDMRYLRAVLNETLRLFPIVPFNVRETANETVWPSPDPNEQALYIPPGTKITYSVFMMQRRTDLWGLDAEEFDPDRFIDERLKKYLIKNSFIFLPFNAGPRICLGQQYAYNEMSFMLIRLAQQFSSISLDLDSAPPEALAPKIWAESQGRKATEKVFPKFHLTMYAAGGLWVKMEEATGTD
ncbi:cytochrome P450 monooxygenase pc-3 [Coprinopsis cinerea okayama7|uniref:Cytochrome P450 monooxygenase pc-3 n=1 Tax=Coprinopsis cinerea (strain Okayama-7 / 130 / ATCC MYA-4618 / FGSC 9003) TaxID=240176 RepID=A8NKN6_COPC7|nr:cytochrome P450 monooxygenase pc-3 [Coprinopsis cinerea okayama7\|eukprot:XP_001834501.1 cytochrome P450 monooxygenase pc-3 [Coprinopsis cinerea okayama7\